MLDRSRGRRARSNCPRGRRRRGSDPGQAHAGSRRAGKVVFARTGDGGEVALQAAQVMVVLAAASASCQVTLLSTSVVVAIAATAQGPLHGIGRLGCRRAGQYKGR